MLKPQKTFAVHQQVNGVWRFWMYAIGRSVKQIVHAVWWRNKGEVSKTDIKAEEFDTARWLAKVPPNKNS